MNKIGPYIQTGGACLDLLERWKPGWALLQDWDSDSIRRARQASPETKLIYRLYEPCGWQDIDEIEWAQQIWSYVKFCQPDVVMFFNEPLGHDDFDLFEEFDHRQANFARWWQSKGVKVGGFAFGEGNWTKDGPDFAKYFPKSLEVIKVILLHEYGWPSMFDGEGYKAMEGYHTGRWPYILEDLRKAGYSDHKVIISECGLTRLVAGGTDQGWQSGGYTVTDETYLADLIKYHIKICEDDGVLAMLPYLFGGYGDMSTFDHLNRPQVVDAIISMDVDGPVPSPPPEPPPQGEITMKFYDADGNEQTEQWAIDEYGFNVIRVEATGQVYRLVQVREKVRQNTHIASLVKPDGAPVEGKLIAFHWPDAEPIPDPVLPYPYDRAHLGPTNADGNCGNGMGPGAYTGRGDCGPHAVWIHDLSIPTDIQTCIGMRQDYSHLNSVFMLMDAEDNGPFPDPGGGRFQEYDRLWEPGEVNELAVLFRGRSYFDLRGHLDIQNWDDLDDPPPWELPAPIHPSAEGEFHFGVTYTPGEGEDYRVYRAYILDVSDGSKVIGGPFLAKWSTEVHGKWTIYVDWISDETPGPEVSGLSDCFEQIGDLFHVASELLQTLKNT